jgi:hypothetical protein
MVAKIAKIAITTIISITVNPNMLFLSELPGSFD